MINKIDLNGTWQLIQTERDINISASVPGCVHIDLMDAKIIKDPFYRDTEQYVQWIGEHKWIYRRVFDIPKALLEQASSRLYCDGLDTLATIYINGKKLGQTDNMFRRWSFDVAGRLFPGENSIEVHFHPVPPYLERRQLERRLPDWSHSFEVDGRGWIRKEPCNFGWDWGPVLITCGIWQDIYLFAFDSARINDVHIKQDHTPSNRVDLYLEISSELISDKTLEIVAILFDEDELIAQKIAPCQQSTLVHLCVPNPKMWWPNGLGDQPLYTLDIELRDNSGTIHDHLKKRIGLRTLSLEREKDEWGESFQFVANGIPFFVKGANWIPADTFVTRLSNKEYRYLLSSAAEVHMNMLRVWGGGIYEQDEFYDLCDELGICIWQDFMFSCSSYPAFDDDFITNVAAEAGDSIRRLRHHPCLALWCGNNELEQGLVGELWTSETMSWTDYDRIFNDLLPDIVRQLDPDRSYWPSSPHTPANREDYNDPTGGDAHLWDVWHRQQPFEWYRTCRHRFNSEFGFQSFPEPKTVDTFTLPGDRNVTSYVMELHQRSGTGNALIMHYMLDWFRLPHRFDMTLWLSQILQGLAIQYAVENWRRSMPRGMGTLYWQLNDCWPVASWSSIDYFGRWKALHYMARRFFAPVLVSAVEDISSGTVDVYITSDMLQSFSGVLSHVVTNLDGDGIDEDVVSVDIEQQTSRHVKTVHLASLIKEHGARNLLVWISLSIDGALVSDNLVTFARPKHLDLFPVSKEANIVHKTEESFVVRVSAEKPALWVWLEIADQDARFSDNFFHIRPGTHKTIRVRPAESLDEKTFLNGLSIRSLVDTYSTEA